jgi:hypothetical protein
MGGMKLEGREGRRNGGKKERRKEAREEGRKKGRKEGRRPRPAAWHTKGLKKG